MAENSKIFLYISCASYVLLIISGILSYFQFQEWPVPGFIWNIVLDVKNSDFPILVIVEILYILFSILLLFALASFIFIIKNRNDSEFGIFGVYSKFHFIPILCATSLHIIGKTFNEDNLVKDIPHVFSLIFNAIGLGSLIFVYIKTNIAQFYERLVIKKGLYSCLIALFVYNLCFNITYYGYLKVISKDFFKGENWIKGCYIAFSIIIGVINLVLSFFLKDVVISGMNLIIYIGMTIYFFDIDTSTRKRRNGIAEGIIDIVFGALTIAMICFLSIRYKKKIFD